MLGHSEVRVMSGLSSPKVGSISFIPTGIRSLLHFILHPSQLLKLHHHIKETDLVIVGGGGLFTDESTLRAVWIWFVHTLVFRLYKKKIVFYAQSFAPLRTGFGKWLTKRACSYATAISVRDHESKETLEKMEVRKKVVVGCDPCFSMQYLKDLRNSNEGCEGKKIPREAREKKYTVVSMRYLDCTNKLYEKALIHFLKYLMDEEGYKVYLTHFGGGKVSDEQYMSKLFAQEMVNNENMQVYKNDSVKSVLSLIAGAQFVIGMRLHSLIFACIAKVPFIGIAYEAKVTQFGKSVNLDEFVLPLQNVSCDTLKEKYHALKKYHTHIVEHLATVQVEMSVKGEENRNLLRAIGGEEEATKLTQ